MHADYTRPFCILDCMMNGSPDPNRKFRAGKTVAIHFDKPGAFPYGNAWEFASTVRISASTA